MKARMIVLTAVAAAALGAAATQIAGAVGDDGRSSVSAGALPVAQSSYEQASARAERLLHNPGLPPWIP
jgi:hypothetical protein